MSCRPARTLEDPVPVQLRTVLLNRAPLRKGNYVMTITMAKHGVAPATSSRAFRLQ